MKESYDGQARSRRYDWKTGNRRTPDDAAIPVVPAKYGMSPPFDRRPAAVRSRPLSLAVARPRRLMNSVRTERMSNDLTQEQLAQAVGVHRNAISGLETGKNVPSIGLALLIAEALQVSVHDIFRLDTTKDIEKMVRWNRRH